MSKILLPNNITLLQDQLGYKFADEQLLLCALSHRSVGKQNNERMEFLGDSLLNFFIAESLFNKFPDATEGELSRLRAHMVKGETLADIARELELGNYLILGSGEMKSGGHRRDSILADAVEAIIGAIYLEAGMDKSRACTLSWYENRLQGLVLANIEKDAKTKLQEYMQRHKKKLPVYRVLNEFGDMHARQYEIECHVEICDRAFVASASSKRAAERLAAEKALSYIES